MSTDERLRAALRAYEAEPTDCNRDTIKREWERCGSPGGDVWTLGRVELRRAKSDPTKAYVRIDYTVEPWPGVMLEAVHAVTGSYLGLIDLTRLGIAAGLGAPAEETEAMARYCETLIGPGQPLSGLRVRAEVRAYKTTGREFERVTFHPAEQGATT